MNDTPYAERLRWLGRPAVEALIAEMGVERVVAAMRTWTMTGRPRQMPPPGDWRTWLVMAGRGFGKTRVGAEWVSAAACRAAKLRIGLIAPTLHDARAVMIEGESGLLAVTPPHEIDRYEPSKRELVWRNGSRATWLSAEEPDSLRGHQFHFLWGDEIARWIAGPDVWMNAQLALRLGNRPRAVLTTTPRPVALVRGLLAVAALPRHAGRQAQGERDSIVVTRGRTADNAANLPAAFIDEVTAAYGGTRLGRQELDGELIEDVEGALWTRAGIEACRVAGVTPPPPARAVARVASPIEGEDVALPSLPLDGGGECAPAHRVGVARLPAYRRVVVGVDPPGSAGGDACGIVVVALGQNGYGPSTGSGHGYVLADRSVRGLQPEGWAAAVAGAAEAFGADRVIAEANNGGEMVASVLRAVEANLPVKIVHASRGKVARAEPVASLYAAGRVSHAGVFPELEDEMCGMVAGGDYAGPGRSPDRADALVWALTELMLGEKKAGPRVRVV